MLTRSASKKKGATPVKQGKEEPALNAVAKVKTPISSEADPEEDKNESPQLVELPKSTVDVFISELGKLYKRMLGDAMWKKSFVVENQSTSSGSKVNKSTQTEWKRQVRKKKESGDSTFRVRHTLSNVDGTDRVTRSRSKVKTGGASGCSNSVEPKSSINEGECSQVDIPEECNSVMENNNLSYFDKEIGVNIVHLTEEEIKKWCGSDSCSTSRLVIPHSSKSGPDDSNNNLPRMDRVMDELKRVDSYVARVGVEENGRNLNGGVRRRLESLFHNAGDSYDHTSSQNVDEIVTVAADTERLSEVTGDGFERLNSFYTESEAKQTPTRTPRRLMSEEDRYDLSHNVIATPKSTGRMQKVTGRKSCDISGEVKTTGRRLRKSTQKPETPVTTKAKKSTDTDASQESEKDVDKPQKKTSLTKKDGVSPIGADTDDHISEKERRSPRKSGNRSTTIDKTPQKAVKTSRNKLQIEEVYTDNSDSDAAEVPSKNQSLEKEKESRTADELSTSTIRKGRSPLKNRMEVIEESTEVEAPVVTSTPAIRKELSPVKTPVELRVADDSEEDDLDLSAEPSEPSKMKSPEKEPQMLDSDAETEIAPGQSPARQKSMSPVKKGFEQTLRVADNSESETEGPSVRSPVRQKSASPKKTPGELRVYTHSSDNEDVTTMTPKKKKSPAKRYTGVKKAEKSPPKQKTPSPKKRHLEVLNKDDIESEVQDTCTRSPDRQESMSPVETAADIRDYSDSSDEDDIAPKEKKGESPAKRDGSFTAEDKKLSPKQKVSTPEKWLIEEVDANDSNAETEVAPGQSPARQKSKSPVKKGVEQELRVADASDSEVEGVSSVQSPVRQKSTSPKKTPGERRVYNDSSDESDAPGTVTNIEKTESPKIGSSAVAEENVTKKTTPKQKVLTPRKRKGEKFDSDDSDDETEAASLQSPGKQKSTSLVKGKIEQALRALDSGSEVEDDSSRQKSTPLKTAGELRVYTDSSDDEDTMTMTTKKTKGESPKLNSSALAKENVRRNTPLKQRVPTPRKCLSKKFDSNESDDETETASVQSPVKQKSKSPVKKRVEQQLTVAEDCEEDDQPSQPSKMKSPEKEPQFLDSDAETEIAPGQSPARQKSMSPVKKGFEQTLRVADNSESETEGPSVRSPVRQKSASPKKTPGELRVYTDSSDDEDVMTETPKKKKTKSTKLGMSAVAEEGYVTKNTPAKQKAASPVKLHAEEVTTRETNVEEQERRMCSVTPSKQKKRRAIKKKDVDVFSADTDFDAVEMSAKKQRLEKDTLQETDVMLPTPGKKKLPVTTPVDSEDSESEIDLSKPQRQSIEESVSQESDDAVACEASQKSEPPMKKRRIQHDMDSEMQIIQNGKPAGDKQVETSERSDKNGEKNHVDEESTAGVGSEFADSFGVKMKKRKKKKSKRNKEKLDESENSVQTRIKKLGEDFLSAISSKKSQLQVIGQVNLSINSVEKNEKKRRRKKRKRKNRVNLVDDDGYIPLEVNGPTKFGIVELDKFRLSKNKHPALNVKDNLLYGSRIKRVPYANVQAYEKKMKCREMRNKKCF